MEDDKRTGQVAAAATVAGGAAAANPTKSGPLLAGAPMPKRNLRSNVLGQNSDSEVAEDHEATDKSLASTLKVRKPEDFFFNFDKRLVVYNGRYELLNNLEVPVVDHEPKTRLFRVTDGCLPCEEPMQKHQDELPGPARNDQSTEFLKSKSQVTVTNVSRQASETVVTKKGKSVVKPHRIRLRARNGPAKKVSDPLTDEIYSRYHKSKLKLEKNFSNIDKTNFLDEIIHLGETFAELVGILDTHDNKSAEVSLILNIIQKKQPANPAVGACSYIAVYTNHVILNNRAPDYRKLLRLLRNEDAADSRAASINNSEENEKNQYNSLKYLMHKNPIFRQDFKNQLLREKGCEELFKYGHMRNNSSLNFKLSYYEKNSSELNGRGDLIFGSFKNFKRFFQGRDHVHTTGEAAVERVVVKFSAKDRALLKSLHKLTNINPAIMRLIDELAHPMQGNPVDLENQKTYRSLNLVLDYLGTLLLLTLYEAFKLLKFFKGYWNYRNEYLSYIRQDKKPKVNKRHIDQFENFGYLDVCMSDDSDDEYSDPDDSASVAELQAKYESAQVKKFQQHYRMDGFDDEDAIPTKKFILRTGPLTRMIFDPQFGTKLFNTQELQKFHRHVPTALASPSTVADKQQSSIDLSTPVVYDTQSSADVSPARVSVDNVHDSYEEPAVPLVDQQYMSQLKRRKLNDQEQVLDLDDKSNLTTTIET